MIFLFQDCFKSFWNNHKVIHKKDKPVYNPWPSFKFTGRLRPAPVVSTITCTNIRLYYLNSTLHTEDTLYESF